jgi:hypothetical protein
MDHEVQQMSVIIPAQPGWAIHEHPGDPIQIIAWEVPTRDEEDEGDEIDPIPISRWGRENVSKEYVRYMGQPDCIGQ